MAERKLDGFGHPSVADAARADLNPLWGPVDEYLHPLYIRQPAPVSNARYVLAYSALTLGFPAPDNNIASPGFLSTNLAYA